MVPMISISMILISWLRTGWHSGGVGGGGGIDLCSLARSTKVQEYISMLEHLLFGHVSIYSYIELRQNGTQSSSFANTCSRSRISTSIPATHTTHPLPSFRSHALARPTRHQSTFLRLESVMGSPRDSKQDSIVACRACSRGLVRVSATRQSRSRFLWVCS